MRIAIVGLVLVALCMMAGCGASPSGTNGPKKIDQAVPLQSSGKTVEQENIAARLVADNKPGSIKHLYVISAYSGQVLIYSTVRGKVTSSGKRLNPSILIGNGANATSYFSLKVHGERVSTAEVMQDDGSYGSSSEYIYWWDTKGVFHQHYLSGGQIIHISDQPLAVKSIVLNMEIAK